MVLFNDIFMIILSVICFITASFVLKKGLEKKNALIFYSIALFGFALSTTFNRFDLITLKGIMRAAALISGAIFIEKTFYNESKGTHRIIFYTICGIAIGDLTFHILYDITAEPFYIISFKYFLATNFLIWGSWMLISTKTAFDVIKDKPVAPHLKKRYTYLKLISVILIALAIANYFTDRYYLGPTHAIAQIFIASFGLIYAIFSTLLWIMPEKLKNKWNQDFNAALKQEEESSEQLSEEEILAQFS